MMKVLCTRAGKCESGATAMEYALTAAILSIALLTGADTLGNAVTNSFTSMSQKMALAAPERSQTVGGKGLVALEPGPSTLAHPGAEAGSFLSRLNNTGPRPLDEGAAWGVLKPLSASDPGPVSANHRPQPVPKQADQQHHLRQE